MNRRNRTIFLLLAALLILLLPAKQADAQAARTDFSGQETFIEDLSLGEEFYPAEKRYHARDILSRFEVAVTDPRASGENLVTINWNFQFVDPPVFVTGPMWGKFKIINQGGSWEGTWTGQRDENGFSFFQFVGEGYDGYEGMKIHFTAERLTPDPSQPEAIRGYILDPGR